MLRRDFKHGSDLVRFALGVGVGWGRVGMLLRSWEENGWGYRGVRVR